jgi:hypothetical protein
MFVSLSSGARWPLSVGFTLRRSLFRLKDDSLRRRSILTSSL